MSWKNSGKFRARTYGTKEKKLVPLVRARTFPGFFFSRHLASRPLNLSRYSSHEDYGNLYSWWCCSLVQTTLQDKGVLIANRHGSTLIPWRHYRLTHMDGYMTTLVAGYEYNFTWQLPANVAVDVTAFSAGIYNMRVNDTVLLKMNFRTAPDHFRIGSVEIDLGRPPVPTDFHR